MDPSAMFSTLFCFVKILIFVFVFSDLLDRQCSDSGQTYSVEKMRIYNSQQLRRKCRGNRQYNIHVIHDVSRNRILPAELY